MRVNVNLQIEVDPEAWEQAYGVGPAEAVIRKDVKAYVLDGVRNMTPSEEGGFKDVYLR